MNSGTPSLWVTIRSSTAWGNARPIMHFRRQPLSIAAIETV